MVILQLEIKICKKKQRGNNETGHEKIMVLRGNTSSCSDQEKGLAALLKHADMHNGQGIKAVLQELIPEYTPDNGTQSITIHQAGTMTVTV